MGVRARRRNDRDISPELWAVLNDAEPPEGADLFDWDFAWTEDQRRAVWQRYREEILERWTREHPGTRPSLWWQWDAPRIPVGTWPGCFWDGRLSEPRRRIGGKGTPAHEALNYVPAFEKGIPTHWVDAWMVDYYNGRTLGDRPRCHWTKDYHEGHFPHEAFDPDDPPTFETEAEYLDRHGLLTDAERAALR
jgi:hypothetical protein